MLKQILNEVKGKKLITNGGVIMTKNYSLIVNIEKRGDERYRLFPGNETILNEEEFSELIEILGTGKGEEIDKSVRLEGNFIVTTKPYSILVFVEKVKNKFKIHFKTECVVDKKVLKSISLILNKIK